MLTTWPITPESAAGGFRKRSTGYMIPATKIAATLPISHFRKLALVITASFHTSPQDTKSASLQTLLLVVHGLSTVAGTDHVAPPTCGGSPPRPRQAVPRPDHHGLLPALPRRQRPERRLTPAGGQPRPPAAQASADGVDLAGAAGTGEHEQGVVDLDAYALAGHHHIVAAQQRHRVTALRDAELGEGLAGEVAVGGRRDRRERDLALAQVEQAHEVGECRLLLDEAGDDLRGVERHVDAPAAVVEPAVARVAYRADHLLHLELVLGQEAGDEVVLVVPGGRDEDVGAVCPRFEEYRRLVDVAAQNADLAPALELPRDGLTALAALLDDGDVVLLADVASDPTPERACACDDDPHAFHPIILWNFSTAVWWTSAYT